jgi:hypothetical protein
MFFFSQNPINEINVSNQTKKMTEWNFFDVELDTETKIREHLFEKTKFKSVQKLSFSENKLNDELCCFILDKMIEEGCSHLEFLYIAKNNLKSNGLLKVFGIFYFISFYFIILFLVFKVD